MIELTNGVQISQDRTIQKVTASVDSLTSTGRRRAAGADGQAGWSRGAQ